MLTRAVLRGRARAHHSCCGVGPSPCSPPYLAIPPHRYVARVLTDWENHRTESEYEKSYIIKSFSFQAVNS